VTNDIIVSATASTIIFCALQCDLIVRSWKFWYIHIREQSLCTNIETSLRYISVARIEVNDCYIFGIQMDCISLKRNDRCWKLNTKFPTVFPKKKKNLNRTIRFDFVSYTIKTIIGDVDVYRIRGSHIIQLRDKPKSF